MGNEKGKHQKLYQSIAKMLCVLIAVIFIMLIVITVVMVNNGISKATVNGLEATAKANGCQIQEYMNVCQSTAQGLVSRIEEVLQGGQAETTGVQESEVYEGLGLSLTRQELENFLISTAKNAVDTNAAVIGIGIMFEPYQFTEGRESYALYFTEENGKVTVSDVGEHSYYSAEGYYQIAVDKTGTVFTEPYTYRDMWMITGATPIRVNGVLVGVINVDVSMSVFNDLSLSNDLYPSMETRVISASGIVDFDSGNAENISLDYADIAFSKSADYTAISSKRQSGNAFHATYRDKGGAMVYSFFYPLKAGSEIWHTVMTVTMMDMQETTILTVVVLFVFSVLCVLILVTVVRVTLKKRLAPIAQVVDAAESIAAGKLNISLRAQSKDEIGDLAEAFQDTSVSLREIIQDISRILGEIAANNFQVETQAAYVGDFELIKRSLDAIVGNLNRAMRNIGAGAGQVSLGAQQMSQTSQTLAVDAQQQANSIESLSEAIRQMAGKIEGSSGRAMEARDRVQEIGQAVEASNSTMSDMVEAMDEISETSRNIEMIIQNIEGIASQTNLLSLNASIEAARAGEAGRGFAVVAEEVQGLSHQSAEAAQNTRKLIGEAIRAVENGTHYAGQMKEAMAGLMERIGMIVSTIEGIAAASEEQMRYIVSVEQDMVKISDVVQNNSGSAEESSATSEELQAQAENLNQLLEEFKFH